MKTGSRVLLMLLLVVAGCAAPPAPRPVVRHEARPVGQGWSEHIRSSSVNARSVASAPGIFHLPNDGDNFQGTDRALAKTEPFASLPEEVSLAALLHQLHDPHSPTNDASMREDHQPPMDKVWNFERVPEEQRNVTIEGWILAAGKESDNDFHLIVSAASVGANQLQPNRDELLNVEISGLPPGDTPDRDKLVKARKEFRDNFVPTVPDTVQGYTLLEPVHVRITGSLFFDVDHKAGVVGPGALKPTTAWEIHPVSALTVLP